MAYEVQVTPAMLAAGVRVLRADARWEYPADGMEGAHDGPDAELVRKIFLGVLSASSTPAE